MWEYRLQNIGAICLEIFLFQALLNCPCSQGTLLFLMKQHFLVFLTCGRNNSEQQGCSGSSKDGHNSCHPIYLMFVFASAVVLKSLMLALHLALSLSYYCMIWKLNPGSDPSHTSEDLLLNWAVAGMGSIAVSATGSLCRRAIPTCPCVSSSPQCPPTHPFWMPVLLRLEAALVAHHCVPGSRFSPSWDVTAPHWDAQVTPSRAVAQGKSAPGAAPQAVQAVHFSDGTAGCLVLFLTWNCPVSLHCAGNVLGSINVLLLICSCWVVPPDLDHCCWRSCSPRIRGEALFQSILWGGVLSLLCLLAWSGILVQVNPLTPCLLLPGAHSAGQSDEGSPWKEPKLPGLCNRLCPMLGQPKGLCCLSKHSPSLR